MKIFSRSILALATMAFAGVAGAQTSNVATVNLNAVKGATLTVVVNSGSGQTANIADNTVTPLANPVNVTTSWNVNESSTTKVQLVGSFTDATAALSNSVGTGSLSSSMVEASTDNGTTYAPFSGNGVGSVGTAGGSLVLYTSPVTTGAARIGSNTQDVKIRYNLTGNNGIPAGTYSGTLNLQAIVQ